MTTIIKEEKYKGFKFQVKLMENCGSWHCGYVSVPKDHSIINKTKDNSYPGGINYDNIDLIIHGGLTYASKEDDMIVIGFDCAHLGDTIEICDEEFVTLECKSMIDQIIQF